MSKRKMYFAIPKDMFFAKTVRNETGCMIWQGEVASNGYPISYKESGGEERLAHRWAWRLERGPLPKGAPLKWSCENRLCVNPEHLYIAETPRGNRIAPEPMERKPIQARERSAEPRAPSRSLQIPAGPIPERIVGRTDRPKAIGILNGSGGMTIGAERAGFEVVGSLEADAEYGRTWRLNRPDQWQAVSIDDWEKLFPGISDDLVLMIGHPPCQGVSGMNAMAGADNPKNKMLPLAAETGMRAGAWYILLENIPSMLSRGAEHVDEVRDLSKKYGYTLEIHKHLASDFGVTQKRRRVMFVLTKRGKEIYWPTDPQPERVPTVWDLISDMNEIEVSQEPHGRVYYVSEPANEYQASLRNPLGFTWNHYRDPLPDRYAHVPIGKRWDQMPREMMSDKERAKVDGERKYFNAGEMVRVDPNMTGKTITGSRNKIHPYATRRLTVREIARMMGFPDDHHFSIELNWQQAAAGVCPPVAEWFCQVIMANLAGEPMPVAEGALF